MKQSKELGFAGHLSEAINILDEVIKDADEHEQEALKYALSLLGEADGIVGRIADERGQELAAAKEPLADKCMICDGALREENVAKQQRNIHAECYESIVASAFPPSL